MFLPETYLSAQSHIPTSHEKAMLECPTQEISKLRFLSEILNKAYKTSKSRKETHLCSLHFTQTSLGDASHLGLIPSWGFSLYGTDINSELLSRHHFDKKNAASLRCTQPLPISVLTLQWSAPGWMLNLYGQPMKFSARDLLHYGSSWRMEARIWNSPLLTRIKIRICKINKYLLFKKNHIKCYIRVFLAIASQLKYISQTLTQTQVTTL